MAVSLLATPQAQETNSGGLDLKADTHAIAQMMDAKNNAVMAVLQKLTTCNAKGTFYRPTESGADSDGCVSPSAASVSVSSRFTTARRNEIVSMGDWTYCSLEAFFATSENHSCEVVQNATGWVLNGDRYNNSDCHARCFRSSQ